MGDGAVGKTSLRKKYMGEHPARSYGMTIGADFSVYKTNIDDEDYTLHIWDLAGQIRFNGIIKSYFVGTLGSMLVFDVTRPESFQNLPNWINALLENTNDDLIPLILVGNKSDLRHDFPESVSKDAAVEYAQALSEWTKIDVPYIETSALTGSNVEDIFIELVRRINTEQESIISS